MNLPNIEKPSHDDIEIFSETVLALGEQERRVLHAIAAAATFETVANLTGLQIPEIPGAVERVGKCKPKDALLHFDIRSRAFVFDKPGIADNFARMMKFIADFTKWCSDAAAELGKAESLRMKLREARRVQW